ncbi:MAG: carbonic anhydrase [Spirochaetales bacterium]|nr:carbonic anhydrase [Spirochaetales bacterium]
MNKQIRVISITKEDDIPGKYRDTPIADFLHYHNFKAPFKTYSSAQLLIGMCMDNRKKLNIPEYFAYIIRTGGANLRYSEFKVSYAIAIGNVKYIILISHNNCGMVNLMAKKDAFIKGLMENTQWDKQRAEEHFINYAPMFEIDNEKQFVIDEAERLMNKYKGIMVVPAFYKIGDNLIYLLEEN